MDVKLKNPEDETRFQLGERWYSYDNGKTWTRQQFAASADGPHMQVTKVDKLRGEITLSGAWSDADGTYPTKE